MAGGRYDNLMSGFLKDSGAIGFAVNVDAATKALRSHRGSLSKVDVIVVCEDGCEIKAFDYINSLAKSKIVEFSLFDTLEQTIAYATKKSIMRVDVVGEQIKIMEL